MVGFWGSRTDHLPRKQVPNALSVDNRGLRADNIRPYRRLARLHEAAVCADMRRWQVARMDLPVRKKIRLEGHDYSSSGTYFVTVCTTQRYALLWEEGASGQDESTLSQTGRIIETAIHQIPNHYKQIEIDRYCVMPDHVHLLVIIHPNETMPCGLAPAAQETNSAILLKVIGSMKRWVSRQLGYSIWQKSFYERIIRNRVEMDEVRLYIQDNPQKRAANLVD